MLWEKAKSVRFESSPRPLAKLACFLFQSFATHIKFSCMSDRVSYTYTQISNATRKCGFVLFFVMSELWVCLVFVCACLVANAWKIAFRRISSKYQSVRVKRVCKYFKEYDPISFLAPTFNISRLNQSHHILLEPQNKNKNNNNKNKNSLNYIHHIYLVLLRHFFVCVNLSVISCRDEKLWQCL